MSRPTACIYCGSTEQLTRDHVPPKLLFCKPYPKNLRTVPACDSCNKSFQADDEYTRYITSMDVRATRSLTAQRQLDSVIRSLRRPNAKAFAKYLAGHIQLGRVLGPNGLPVNMIEVDKKRVNACGERILRAFYYLETGAALSRGSRIKIAVVPTDPRDPGIQFFARMYQRCPDRREGELGSVFSYIAGLEKQFSMWLMVLYEFFAWMATVEPNPVERIE